MPFWRRLKRKFAIVGELWGFMKENRKWWLAPILVVLLLVLFLVLVGGSPAGGIIYTLF